MTSSTPRCSPIASTVSIGDDEMITVLRPGALVLLDELERFGVDDRRDHLLERLADDLA